MAFKSSKGRDAGKEIETWQSSRDVLGVNAGGGAGGAEVVFTGFNPDPAILSSNGTPVGVSTDAWQQLTGTGDGNYIENQSPGRYFDFSIKAPDGGNTGPGNSAGPAPGGYASGTIYIEKDQRIYIKYASGGGGGGPGGAGMVITNVNALEPESDRPGSTLLVAGGAGGSTNGGRGGTPGGGRQAYGVPGTEVSGGPNSAGNGSGGSATLDSAGGGQSSPQGSGSPGGVWTGGPANSGGPQSSGGGGGGWYGGGGAGNASGGNGSWGGGGAGSAYYAQPDAPITNPAALYDPAPKNQTTSQTTFNNGTFLEGSGLFFRHRDLPAQNATTIFVRVADDKLDD